MSGASAFIPAGKPSLHPGARPLIRPADAADIVQVQAIYAHHVLHGTASFEEEPPDIAEMTTRWQALVERDLPYLVAERGDHIVGFAYAGPFRPRNAYRYTLEDSIYVHPQATGQGVGRALMGDLIARVTALGYRQLIAVIGDAANTSSIALHASYGFVEAGRLLNTGFKFNRWLDVVFMQKALGADTDDARSAPAPTPRREP
ncbi:MAG: N-acetyltransferase family protein [Rhodospirillales bacterium]